MRINGFWLVSEIAVLSEASNRVSKSKEKEFPVL